MWNYFMETAKALLSSLEKYFLPAFYWTEHIASVNIHIFNSKFFDRCSNFWSELLSIDRCFVKIWEFERIFFLCNMNVNQRSGLLKTFPSLSFDTFILFLFCSMRYIYTVHQNSEKFHIQYFCRVLETYYLHA